MTIALLIGGVSGAFLVFTLHNMFKGKLFWIADRGLDLIFTLLAPIFIGGGTATGAVTALALGVSFTVTLRIAHAFLPGEYLQFRIIKGWPRLMWVVVPPKKIELPRFGTRY